MAQASSSTGFAPATTMDRKHLTRAEIDDPKKEGKLDESEALDFLEGLQSQIATQRNLTPATPPDWLLESVKPFSHQLEATAACLYAEKTPFKGMILADKGGMGKTLSILMALVKGRKPGDGACVIVVPPSLTYHWMEEIETHFDEFHPDALGTIFVTEGDIDPFDLRKHDIIITTYHYIAAENKRLNDFVTDLAKYNAGNTNVVPKRPHVAFLSGIWEFAESKPIGRWLVLDEPDIIADTHGEMFKAIRKLRERFVNCLIATDTLFNGSWEDVFAYVSLLRGHPFTSMLRMRQIFTDAFAEGQKTPVQECVPQEGKSAQLLNHFLNAVVLSRPESAISTHLPYKDVQVWRFTIPTEEMRKYNEKTEEWKSLPNGPAAYGRLGVTGHVEWPRAKWMAWIESQIWVTHPELLAIKDLEYRVTVQDILSADDASYDVLSDEELERHADWLHNIKQGEKYRSARIDAIIKILNTKASDEACLILDESIFFLDILEIAIEALSKSKVFRYDARKNDNERYDDLEAFRDYEGNKVMLATRSSGGHGLNIQCANIVIRCGTWWRESWNKKAEARCWRLGQTKPVVVFQLLPSGFTMTTTALSPSELRLSDDLSDTDQ